MLDIRLIREKPDEVKARLSQRDPAWAEKIDAALECDRKRRAAETELQKLNGDRKRLSKEIGGRKSRQEDSSDLETQVKGIGQRIGELSRAAAEADSSQRDLLLGIPNLPHPKAPLGVDAAQNPLVRVWGEKPSLPENVQDHLSLGKSLGLFDLERAAKISGSGFICFSGWGARLQRALINFMMDLHSSEAGYSETLPPILVRGEVMEGTGQLPKFEEDMYGIRDENLYLAPTAEVPVTNLHREEILKEEQLPLKFVAYTPCFRKEAGSGGKDVRGLIRAHQFDKVELVKLTAAENSYQELESLTVNAEKVLQLLGLHYRVIELCTGDLGFSAAKTYDIEVWAPAQEQYLEVSSCSNFEDYQARRMKLRYRDSEGKNRFCHTLNGSGTALPRLFVALIETCQQPDGSILLPEPLQDYMKAEKIPAA